jgi:hypothetical protein
MSGFQFWNTVNTVLLNKRARMYQGDGIDFVENKLKEAPIEPEDIVLLAIDNIGSDVVYELYEFAVQDKINRQYKLLFSAYYCFEEFFLSFKRIIDWVLVLT